MNRKFRLYRIEYSLTTNLRCRYNPNPRLNTDVARVALVSRTVRKVEDQNRRERQMRILGIVIATLGFGLLALNLIMSFATGYNPPFLPLVILGAIGIVGVIIMQKGRKPKQ